MRNIDWEVVLVRIRLIVKYCDNLEKFVSISLDEYLGDFDQQLIVERLIQLIVEVATDINEYLLLHLYEVNPTTNFDSFNEAGQKGIITQNLADELVQSVGMRNILVYQYEDINSRIVFSVIPRALEQYRLYVQQVTAYRDLLET
ncbi:type VII toxin-antitoxin system HepT family RNase toxin [Scytonema sp. NUACC26]|uniref:type VII toxin-antitoxin system HepT family RNase toxin n=1 Tax=Scytonema sp. NUACC26 TaxID=3140176 RepID=UPI0034DCA665